MESLQRRTRLRFRSGRTEQQPNTKTDGHGHACKGIVPAQPARELGLVGRKTTRVPSPQRESSNQSAPCGRNFKVELGGRLTWASKIATGYGHCPVDPLTLPYQAERPDSQMASAWGGACGPAPADLLRHRPDDRKKAPAIFQRWPPLHPPSRSTIRSTGKPVHSLAVAAHTKTRGPAQSTCFSFKLHQNLGLSLIVRHASAGAGACTSHRVKGACLGISGRQTV